MASAQDHQADEDTDKYKHLGNIGWGTFGVVFKAEKKKKLPGDEDYVAIKQLDKFQEKSVKREIDCLLQVENCRNIVRLYEHYDKDKWTFLVLEFCDLGNLSDHVKKRNTIDANGRVQCLSELEIIDLLTQLSRGLYVLYKKGIIHRDIKPENILLKTAHDGFVFKLADMGLSRYLPRKFRSVDVSPKVLQLSDEDSKMTVTGTPDYQAPELVNFGDGPIVDPKSEYDSRVDIFSLGVLVLFCILGQKPWKKVWIRGLASNPLRESQLADRVVSYLPPKYRSDLIKLVSSMLEYDPQKRISVHNFCISDLFKVHTMFVVIGQSGVGKSSTIKHLIDHNDDLGIRVNHYQSETKATTEYVCSVADEKNRSLGIVDTPGLGDTDGGIEQDSRNLECIREFLDKSPDLRPLDGSPRRYPNLVILVLKADDPRVLGKTSQVSKCLRTFVHEKMGLIDKNKKNLIVVLTRATKIDHAGGDEGWLEAFEERRNVFSQQISTILGFIVPIIGIENVTSDLRHVGDWTCLPDGTRQPRNLFEAIENKLAELHDFEGRYILETFFGRGKDDAQKTPVHAVQKMSVPCSEREGLSRNELWIYQMLQDENFQTPPIDVSSIDEDSIASADDFSEDDRSIVSSWDAVSRMSVVASDLTDAVIANEGIVGRGYNFMKEEVSPFPIWDIPGVSDIQSTLPEGINLDCRQAKGEIMKQQSLLAQDVRKVPKLEEEILEKMFSGLSCNKSQFTKVFKVDVAKVTLNKNVETMNKYVGALNKTFKKDIKKLPQSFTDDDGSTTKFSAFFNNYGHGLITTATLGGQLVVSEIDKYGQPIKVKRNGIKPVADALDAPLSIFNRISAGAKTFFGRGSMKGKQLEYTGGNGKYHSPVFESETQVRKWKDSLTSHPAIFVRDPRQVIPMWEVVRKIDPQRATAVMRAMDNIFEPTRKDAQALQRQFTNSRR